METHNNSNRAHTPRSVLDIAGVSNFFRNTFAYHPTARRISIATSLALVFLALSVPCAIMAGNLTGQSARANTYGSLSLFFAICAYVSWLFRSCLFAIKEHPWSILLLVVSLLCFAITLIEAITLLAFSHADQGKSFPEGIAANMGVLLAGMAFLSVYDYWLQISPAAPTPTDHAQYQEIQTSINL